MSYLQIYTSMTVYSCAAGDCNAHTNKKNNLDKYPWMKGVQFYAFPHKIRQKDRRRVWIQRCRRDKDWAPTVWDRVCSRHFVGGVGPTDAHPNPELFKYNSWGETFIALPHHEKICRSKATGRFFKFLFYA
jgi:hypothetical protein